MPRSKTPNFSAKIEEKPHGNQKTNHMVSAFVEDPTVVLLRRRDVHAHLLLAGRAAD